ncbi:hypothetical protein ACGC1H_003216 [Rhizoctonia solani]
MDLQTRAFDDVPREILVRILHNCDYVTIIRFSLTCNKAYEAVSSSVSLQLHIELEINGLEIADGSSKGNLNYSLILKELRDYRNAWLNLKLSPLASQRIATLPGTNPSSGNRLFVPVMTSDRRASAAEGLVHLVIVGGG